MKPPATLPVVKEELLSLQDSPFGKDPNAVVSIHHDNYNSSNPTFKPLKETMYRKNHNKLNQSIL